MSRCEGCTIKPQSPLIVPLPLSEKAQFKDMAREIVDHVKAGHYAAAYARLPSFIDLCPNQWEHENKKVHVLSGVAYDALRQDHPEWAQKYLSTSDDGLERANLLPTMVDERRSVRALFNHVSRGGSLETCPRLPRVMTLAFVCPDNAVLSPIAEVLAAHEGGNLLHAISGGVDPAREIFPLSLKVISEIGLSLLGQRPKRIPQEVLERYHTVVGINSSRQEVLSDSKKGRFKQWRIKMEQLEDLQEMRRTRDAVHRLVSGHLAELGMGFKNEPER